MSVPKHLAITFDKDELDKAIRENAQSIAETSVGKIDKSIGIVYNQPQSPSHIGEAYVRANPDKDSNINKVTFK